MGFGINKLSENKKKKFDLDNFWKKDIKAGKCTDKDLKIFEKRYKVKLPENLKKLYKIQNGGSIKFPYFREQISKKSFKNHFYEGLIESIDKIDNTDKNICSLQPIDIRDYYGDDIDWFIEDFGNPDYMFAFCGDGHYYYALDYNNWTLPRIIYIDIEGGVEMEEVYSSFNKFLESQYFGEKEIHKEILDLNVREELVSWTKSIYDDEYHRKYFINNNGKYCFYLYNKQLKSESYQLFVLSKEIIFEEIEESKEYNNEPMIKLHFDSNGYEYTSSILEENGLWLNETFDYLPKSIKLSKEKKLIEFIDKIK